MHNDISTLGLIFLHSFRDKWNERRARHTMKHERLTTYIITIIIPCCVSYVFCALMMRKVFTSLPSLVASLAASMPQCSQCRQAIHLGANIRKYMLSIFHGAATNQTMAKQPNRMGTFHFQMYVQPDFYIVGSATDASYRPHSKAFFCHFIWFKSAHKTPNNYHRHSLRKHLSVVVYSWLFTIPVHQRLYPVRPRVQHASDRIVNAAFSMRITNHISS